MLRAILVFPGKITVKLEPILQRSHAVGEIGDEREGQEGDAVCPPAERQVVQKPLRQIVEHQDLDYNFLLTVEIDESEQATRRSGNANRGLAGEIDRYKAGFFAQLWCGDR